MHARALTTRVSSRHEMLALADVLVHSASNLHFGPEVGIGKPKVDTAVVEPWMKTVEAMADDLGALRLKANGVEAVVHRADAEDSPLFSTTTQSTP